MSKICVLGQGYIGLPTALLFANGGHEVVGIDVNKRVVETLKAGKMPFEEQGFQELLDSAIAKKSIPSRIALLKKLMSFLVAVPTPFDLRNAHGRSQICSLSLRDDRSSPEKRKPCNNRIHNST
jgi:UDP-N-acetyl-D-mannosaminuronic acid dehydrogenase